MKLGDGVSYSLNHVSDARYISGLNLLSLSIVDVEGVKNRPKIVCKVFRKLVIKREFGWY